MTKKKNDFLKRAQLAAYFTPSVSRYLHLLPEYVNQLFCNIHDNTLVFHSRYSHLIAGFQQQFCNFYMCYRIIIILHPLQPFPLHLVLILLGKSCIY